jgi:hypothetical protein
MMNNVFEKRGLTRMWQLVANKDSQAILLPFVVFLICFQRLRRWTKRNRNLAWS